MPAKASPSRRRKAEGMRYVATNIGHSRKRSLSPQERRSSEGIPDPELVDAPGERWRSRMHESRWQVNSGHPDFRELLDRPGLKLRNLAMLFAKEVVLHDTQDPRLGAPLEQLVEVAAYADRQLAPKRRGKRGGDEPVR